MVEADTLYAEKAKRESLRQLWKPDRVRAARFSAAPIGPGTTSRLPASSIVAPSLDCLKAGPGVWCSNSVF